MTAVGAAAGHRNGVFALSPQQLQQITGAPVHDVVQEGCMNFDPAPLPAVRRCDAQAAHPRRGVRA